MNSTLRKHLRQGFVAVVALIVAAAIWLPCLHFCFRKPISDFYQEKGLSPAAFVTRAVLITVLFGISEDMAGVPTKESAVEPRV